MTFPMHPFRELRHSALSLVLLVAFAGMAGCGSDNSSGGMVSPPGWVVVPSGGQHATSATLTYISNGGTSSCAECHGADLSGGTSLVSCLENPAGCHHGPVANWATPAVHGATAKQAPSSPRFASCQLCHGADFRTPRGDGNRTCYSCHSLAPHPDGPWRSSTGSTHTNTDPSNAPVCAGCHRNDAPGTPGCFNNTLCHNGGGGGTTHAVPYNDPAHFGVSAAAFPASCGTCHDDFAPSTKVGPVCRTCHGAASPLTSFNCTSCHGDPPSGATYPNAAGKHAVHDGLPGVEVCNPCHNGLEAGTLEHYNRANARPGKDALRVPPGDVAFLGTYNAQSGPAAFNPENRTCSNVICHGGQATPDWQTPEADSIDVVNACTSCHVAGTTQYNSYFSGRHDTHITEFGLNATTCKLCHDVAKVNVTGHFQNLATPEFEQAPGETILPDVQYIGNTCNPTGDLTGCHAGNPNRNRPWF
jgi:predicted CxxxxCH...CXXCH cytochrome family protein